MKDVAAAAGVGLKTVSRVVNGEAGVSRATEQRVQRAIKSLGFRPNHSAGVLRTGMTSTIGLLVQDIAEPFQSELAGAIEEVAADHGFLVIIVSSHSDPNRERESALALCSRRVDGLVLVPTVGSQAYLKPEMESGTPIVAVDRPAQDLAADTVLSDNSQGMKLAVDHLVSQGHTMIGYLGDRPDLYTSVERLAGYKSGLLDCEIPVRPDLVFGQSPTEEALTKSLEALVSAGATAVITGNTWTTFSALPLIRRLARPLKHVAFDDFKLSSLLDPPLTVIAQDPRSMGRAAAETLMSRIKGDLGPRQKIILETRLIAR
jgi:LacI family transcriptional regulator